MGERVSNIRKELKGRWQQRMPKFFRGLMWLCGLISGTALAVNTAITAAGIQPHEWWIDIMPYLIGVPAGMMFACKFTVENGYKKPKKKKL